MMMQPLPDDFVLSISPLTWKEILWGYDHQLVKPSALIEIARRRSRSNLDAGSSLSQLASSMDDMPIRYIVVDLATNDPVESEESISKKWLYWVLRWAFENRHCLQDPLGVAEMIYADFYYPPEMEPFIRFMPVTDGYDPTRHSLEENEQRLMRKWQEYLEKFNA